VKATFSRHLPRERRIAARFMAVLYFCRVIAYNGKCAVRDRTMSGFGV
jgi:hypothetical protein